jgi:hypothetical protein
MPEEPLRVELVQSGSLVKSELAKGLLSLGIAALVVGLQWWSMTPEAERLVKLRKLGITRCRVGRWHVMGLTVSAWPPGPGRCLCSWPETAGPESQLLADQAEEAAINQKK